MKNKITIFLLSIMVFCFAATGTLEASSASANLAPVDTKEVPSTSFLMKEKQSIASSIKYSAGVNPSQRVSSSNYAGDNWEEPNFPGTGGETGPGGNVGGPIGDVTLPIVLSILVMYLIFRTLAVSRRKNNI